MFLKGRGEQCFQVCLFFAVSPVNPLCRCWSGATWLAEETLGRNLRGFLRPKHPLQIIPGLQGDSCNNETKGIATDAGRIFKRIYLNITSGKGVVRCSTVCQIIYNSNKPSKVISVRCKTASSAYPAHDATRLPIGFLSAHFICTKWFF